MPMQSKFTDTRHAATAITRAVFRFGCRSLSSLMVWILPLLVAAVMVSLLTGRLSFHQSAGLDHDPDQTASDAKQPLMVVKLEYSRDYIKVVTKARERSHDFLASFKTLESAWNVVSPSRPFVFGLVSSPHTQPTTANGLPPALTTTVMVDEANFGELRTFLEDLRDLVVQGDGTGCGRLRRSGYLAQPVENVQTQKGA
jgi:hypothetical protein